MSKVSEANQNIWHHLEIHLYEQNEIRRINLFKTKQKIIDEFSRDLKKINGNVWMCVNFFVDFMIGSNRKNSPSKLQPCPDPNDRVVYIRKCVFKNKLVILSAFCNPVNISLIINIKSQSCFIILISKLI